MEGKTTPGYSRILNAVKPLTAHARHVIGVWYRCVETSYAHEIVSGEGARLHGGRWNPRDSFCTVYLSDRPETALEEYLARARRMKWPDHKSMPMVMAGVEVSASQVLDLRISDVATVLEPFLQAEPQHWRAIQAGGESVSQSIGRAARECRLQGLLAESQQVEDGLNLVLFPDRFGAHDRLASPKVRLLP